jgi:hypothetical protein
MVVMNKKEEKRIWKIVKKLRKKGLLPPLTEDDKQNEPTALANSKYRLNLNKDE